MSGQHIRYPRSNFTNKLGKTVDPISCATVFQISNARYLKKAVDFNISANYELIVCTFP